MRTQYNFEGKRSGALMGQGGAPTRVNVIQENKFSRLDEILFAGESKSREGAKIFSAAGGVASSIISTPCS